MTWDDKPLPPKWIRVIDGFVRRNWQILFYLLLIALFVWSAIYSEPAPDPIDYMMTECWDFEPRCR